MFAAITSFSHTLSYIRDASTPLGARSLFTISDIVGFVWPFRARFVYGLGRIVLSSRLYDADSFLLLCELNVVSTILHSIDNEVGDLKVDSLPNSFLWATAHCLRGFRVLGPIRVLAPPPKLVTSHHTADRVLGGRRGGRRCQQMPASEGCGGRRPANEGCGRR